MIHNRCALGLCLICRTQTSELLKWAMSRIWWSSITHLNKMEFSTVRIHHNLKIWILENKRSSKILLRLQTAGQQLCKIMRSQEFTAKQRQRQATLRKSSQYWRPRNLQTTRPKVRNHGRPSMCERVWPFQHSQMSFLQSSAQVSYPASAETISLKYRLGQLLVCCETSGK